MAKLTRERLRELLSYEPETGVFTWRVSRGGVRAGSVAGSISSGDYRQIRIDGKKHLTHRLVWLYVHGCWPVFQIDHINGVRDDNRIANLREAKSQTEQQQNRGLRSDSTSGHEGVYWCKRDGKWVAHIAHKGKRHHLGYFDDLQEAARVRRAAKRKYHKFCPEARSA